MSKETDKDAEVSEKNFNRCDFTSQVSQGLGIALKNLHCIFTKLSPSALQLSNTIGDRKNEGLNNHKIKSLNIYVDSKAKSLSQFDLGVVGKYNHFSLLYRSPLVKYPLPLIRSLF